MTTLGLDDTEEVQAKETGTFKRASEEVVANRRIVKVKRSQPSSTPSSNPFAAIRLVPPADSTSEQAASPSSVNKAELAQNAEEVRKPEATDSVAEKENDESKELRGKRRNCTSDGKMVSRTFALKFRDASIVDKFRSVVMAHAAAPSLKTPENSPKASDE
ncbi:nuclear pore complex protein NUP50A-like protein [Tanacetum coccineum]